VGFESLGGFLASVGLGLGISLFVYLVVCLVGWGEWMDGWRWGGGG